MKEIILPSGRKIGDGHAPFIIAEIGSNWLTLEDCLHSIRSVKAAGADAAKFQLYDNWALYGIEAAHVEASMSTEWLPSLKRECDKVGIEFMCSAFSPELFDKVNSFVNIHKIASAECTHVRILERARDAGKPVILSTGAHGVADIKQSLEILQGVPVVLMYCVAAYPAKEIHFGVLHKLRDFGTLVGYSDHSIDALNVPNASTAYGACVIEKHVTFIDAETPDSPHSLNDRQFRAMIKQINGGEEKEPGATAEETPMVLRHNRRLIATRDISPGQEILENVNMGIYRSLIDDTKALSPFAIGKVHGKKAKGPIKAGEGIGPGDFE